MTADGTGVPNGNPSGHSGDDPADRQFARTLANGIDLLLAYRPGETLLGNRDFVQRTGLSKSTVARLTHIVNSGVPARPGTFDAVHKRVGPRLVALARALEDLLGLR